MCVGCWRGGGTPAINPCLFDRDTAVCVTSGVTPGGCAYANALMLNDKMTFGDKTTSRHTPNTKRGGEYDVATRAKARIQTQ